MYPHDAWNQCFKDYLFTFFAPVYWNYYLWRNCTLNGASVIVGYKVPSCSLDYNSNDYTFSVKEVCYISLRSNWAKSCRRAKKGSQGAIFATEQVHDTSFTKQVSNKYRKRNKKTQSRDGRKTACSAIINFTILLFYPRRQRHISYITPQAMSKSARCYLIIFTQHVFSNHLWPASISIHIILQVIIIFDPTWIVLLLISIIVIIASYVISIWLEGDCVWSRKSHQLTFNGQLI